ncbi:MAG: tetratricopeptide repeat protein [Betaproteobacteria bacterium]|nr:tetratricopeptide repeat protein [Betaproteobacteria bacterium]
MAVYDLEEQETLDSLKSWWKRQGHYVAGGLMVVALAAAGTQGYRYWRNTQTVKAGEVYAQLEQAVRDNDAKKVREVAGHISESYASTGYAAMAALAAAKASFEAGDLKSAAAQLKWVVDNSKDEELRAVARLRWAGILLDEKNYDAALAQLNEKHPESFGALFADARGDVLVAQGKPGDARTAYKLALEKSPPDNAYRPVIQVKLDDLGGHP